MGNTGYYGPKLPKFDFPKFDGSHPKYWLSQCQDYFELYGTETHMWVRVAKMHFTGDAARWSSSVEHQLQTCSWHTFSSLILERFGQEQHELLLRQFFQLRQTGPIQDYINQYTALVDQLNAYGGTREPLYYAMRFVDGLKDPIRAVVSMHRPKDLDTACLLAKLQEEVADPMKKRDGRRWDTPMTARPFAPKALPLPPPPPRLALPTSELRPAVEGARGPSPEDRWSALRATRHAQGLCMRCGGKWSRDHQCPPTVQLHVVQELLDVFQLDDVHEPEDPPEEQITDQVFLSVSVAAVSGVTAPRTMCFWGQLGDHQIRILLDSGSSHTFISTELAARFSSVQKLSCPLQVQVANGQILTCSTHIPDASRSIQSCQFISNLKVLPLSAYDMILGLDWLEDNSPMEVHWGQKWIQFTHKGNSVQLVGILSDLPSGAVLHMSASETSPMDDLPGLQRFSSWYNTMLKCLSNQLSYLLLGIVTILFR